MSKTDLAAFEAMAQRAIESFPDPFRRSAAEVLVEVVDWPPEDVLAEMEIVDPLELTGLYEGIPLTERSVSDPSPWPDRVWLFREPILAEWRDGGTSRSRIW